VTMNLCHIGSREETEKWEKKQQPQTETFHNVAHGGSVFGGVEEGRLQIRRINITERNKQQRGGTGSLPFMPLFMERRTRNKNNYANGCAKENGKRGVQFFRTPWSIGALPKS